MADPDWFAIECSSCCCTSEVMMDLGCKLTDYCFIVGWNLRGMINHALKCVVKDW